MKVKLLNTIQLANHDKRFCFRKGLKYNAQIAYNQPDFAKRGLLFISKRSGETALIGKKDYQLIEQDNNSIVKDEVKYKRTQISQYLDREIIANIGVKGINNNTSINKLSGKLQNNDGEYFIGEKDSIIYFTEFHVEFININGDKPEFYISY